MMLTGNDGILRRAGKAKIENEKATIKEQAQMVKMNLDIVELANIDTKVLEKPTLIKWEKKLFSENYHGVKILIKKIKSQRAKF